MRSRVGRQNDAGPGECAGEHRRWTVSAWVSRRPRRAASSCARSAGAWAAGSGLQLGWSPRGFHIDKVADAGTPRVRCASAGILSHGSVRRSRAPLRLQRARGPAHVYRQPLHHHLSTYGPTHDDDPTDPRLRICGPAPRDQCEPRFHLGLRCAHVVESASDAAPMVVPHWAAHRAEGRMGKLRYPGGIRSGRCGSYRRHLLDRRDREGSDPHSDRATSRHRC